MVLGPYNNRTNVIATTLSDYIGVNVLIKVLDNCSTVVVRKKAVVLP
jgi:hypothetical protein